MRLTELFTDENAASPVVGVILVIGIVVILAAGIGGTLVSTLDTSEPAPSANYEDEQGDQLIIADGGNQDKFPVVTIRHDSGDQLNRSRLRFKVNGEKAWSIYRNGDKCDSGVSECDKTTDISGDGSFSTGDTVTVAVKDHPDLTEDMSFSIDEDDNIIVPTDGTPDTESNHIGLEEGDTVRLIWLSKDRESSQTLYQTDVSTGV